MTWDVWATSTWEGPPFWALPLWCSSCDKPLLPLAEEPEDFGAVLCGACA